MNAPFNAYHFTGDKLRDGRPVPAIGETLIHEGDWEWCESGLYASREAWQALEFAPGHMLHRVHCEDILREDEAKFVCRRRTIIASINAESLLREFARSCALDVIHLWNAPDVVREYLETGDEDKRAAAWDAARDAAWDAAWDAARAAARAAWDAAWDAARAAARAAWAAREKQRARFTSMVNEAFDQ